MLNTNLPFEGDDIGEVDWLTFILRTDASTYQSDMLVESVSACMLLMRLEAQPTSPNYRQHCRRGQENVFISQGPGESACDKQDQSDDTWQAVIRSKKEAAVRLGHQAARPAWQHPTGQGWMACASNISP